MDISPTRAQARQALPYPAAEPPVADLFPSAADRTRGDDALTRSLAAAHERLIHGAVAPTLDHIEFRRALAGFDFAVPRPLDDSLAWIIEQMEHGVTQTTHPRYLGLFNPAPSFPAQCADRIAAAFNPQLASATTSPAAVEIEAHVIRSVARRAGLPAAASGHFTSGGAEANFTALLCALTRTEPGFAMQGARAFTGPPVFYASAECHLAWLKIAHQAGVGRAGLRLVATDGAGRMCAGALSGAMAADRAQGCVPVMVVATAGTTGAGAIDPLAECAGLARRFGAWFHVDAAWGGALIASNRLRGLLAGIEAADSVTIDAHKWLATTMGCGMFLCADPAAPLAVFQASNSFMPPSGSGADAAVDPYVASAQWSRRFLGLRLFLSLAAAGWAGYGAHVERSIALAGLLRDRLAERGWRIANDPALAVICAEPPPGSGAVRDVVGRVLASGRAWVSAARFEGREVVRACVTNGDTTVWDIEQAAHALHSACHQSAS